MTSLMLTIPLTIITVLSILLNTFIIIIVIISRQVAAANNILLLHLGTINTLLGLLFLIFSTPTVLKTNWLTTGVPCYLHGFLFNLLHPLLMWTVCGLNCDRYYAIAAPLHYTHIVNSKKILIGLGTGWLISLALCIPPLFAIAPYTFIPGFGVCTADFSRGFGALWYTAVYTAVTLLLPATLIICCNVKILMIARYHRHRIASAIYEVTLSAQVTITHQRNPFFVPTVTAPSAGGPKFRARSPISALLQILGSFLLVYLPYYTTILWQSSLSLLDQSITPTPNTQHLLPSFRTIDIQSITFALLTCSPMVNGFLYGVRSTTIRKTFQNYWRKQVTKNEMNQEIQARTPSTCGSRRQSLTPLGFFTTRSAVSNTMPRRLSEALLDVHSDASPKSMKMKRIASELTTWRRPGSTNGLHIEPRARITQTTSCNTLQVPRNGAEELEDEPIVLEPSVKLTPHRIIDNILTLPTRPSLSSTNLFLSKFFGHSTTVITPPKKSPTILITQAFADDVRQQQQQQQTKATSTSNMFEEDNPAVWCEQPLLQDDSRNHFSSDSSEDRSSEDSLSSGRLYMNLDRCCEGNMGAQDSSVSTNTEVDGDGNGNEESHLLLMTTLSDRQKLMRDRRQEVRTNFFKQNGVLANDIQEVVL